MKHIHIPILITIMPFFLMTLSLNSDSFYIFNQFKSFVTSFDLSSHFWLLLKVILTECDSQF